MSSLFLFAAEAMSFVLGEAVSTRLRQLPLWVRFVIGLLVALAALVGAGAMILLGLMVWEVGSGIVSG